MFSLIITVQSIALNANLVLAHLSKQYATQTETQLEQDADYAIPSLIWPPPAISSHCINTRSAQSVIYTLLCGGVRHD